MAEKLGVVAVSMGSLCVVLYALFVKLEPTIKEITELWGM